MRKLRSDFILAPGGNLLSDHTLILENDTVKALIPETDPDAEYYDGILCPGFINAHCHLELSHLKNKTGRGAGLSGFIADLVAARANHPDGVAEAAEAADMMMWKSGIQAVGDICNTDVTFGVKKISNIRYHSFIELFNLNPAKANEVFESGKKLMHSATELHQHASLVPHAPYSVPPALFNLIKAAHDHNQSLWCIHHQESAAENEMFQKGEGSLMDRFAMMGIDMSWFSPLGENSSAYLKPFLPKQSNILMVHNTYSREADLTTLMDIVSASQLWFCLCPQANLYIESRLPDIPMFLKNNCNLVIGTDSLASNHNLSMLEEMKAIHQQYPEIQIGELLKWATENGAAYFGWDDLGTFKPGTKPGVVCIKGCDDSRIDAYAVAERVV